MANASRALVFWVKVANLCGQSRFTSVFRLLGSLDGNIPSDKRDKAGVGFCRVD